MLHPTGRPFVLVYSVAQDLVSYQHFAQPSNLYATLDILSWLQQLVELDLFCLAVVFAFLVYLTQTLNAQLPVQQYDRQVYYNLFFLSTSIFPFV